MRSASRRRLLLTLCAAALGTSAPAVAASAARPGPPAAPPPVVTVLGDSITAGLGLPAAAALPAQLQLALARLGVAARVRGAGVSGDTTAGGLARAGFSVQADTAVCVVELGANDLLQSIPPVDTERNLRALAVGLRKRGMAVVLAGGRPPARSTGGYGREFAAVFPRVARETGAVLAPDLLAGIDGPALRQADGLHPNAEGARRAAARLAPAVARALRDRRPRTTR